MSKLNRILPNQCLVAVVAVALVAGLIPAGASASRLQPLPGTKATPELIAEAETAGVIDHDTALLYTAYALRRYELLPVEYHSNAPWDGTLPLHRIRAALAKPEPVAFRSTIEQLLSGNCSGGSNLPSTMQSAHFFIEYGPITGGLTVNDYAAAFDKSWDTEVISFGWAGPPVLTSNPAPGNLYHLQIDNLSPGLYGFCSSAGDHAGFVGNNPATAWNDQDAFASCIVINADLTGYPSPPLESMTSTAAHEFNHSIQYGYGALDFGGNAPDDAMVEGGASWMEDEAMDAADDNRFFLWPSFTTCMGSYAASPYAYWVVWRALTERFGTTLPGGSEKVMQVFWEEHSKNTGNNLGALTTAFASAGTTLEDAYHSAAIALRFNRACGGGYVYPYCLEEGPGYVSIAGANNSQHSIAAVGQSTSGTIPDNYALNWVDLPNGGGPFDATLTNNDGSGGALRGSIVCDTGAAFTVRAFPAVAGPGASSTLTGFDPTGCTKIVAVITNQAKTADHPSSCTPRSYTLALATGTVSGPIVLKAVKPLLTLAPDVLLFWTGDAPPYTIFRGTTPTNKVQIGPPLLQTNYTDLNALPETPSDRYFYEIQ